MALIHEKMVISSKENLDVAAYEIEKKFNHDFFYIAGYPNETH
jgi:hypothetical protein